MEKKDINFTLDNNRFNFRVACFITFNNSALLVKNDNCDFYNLPGGRAKINESTLDAVKREIQEELAIEIVNPKLFYIFENFFNWIDKNVQELLFVYHIKLDKNSPLLHNNSFANKDNYEENFYWVKFDEIKNIKCLPEIIYNLPKMNFNQIKHSINN